MKRIDFSKLGGLHVYQDTLEYMQEEYRNSLMALSVFTGEKYVLSGCVDDGVNVSAGYIVVDGEIVPFAGGALAARIVVSEVVTQESFDDATLKDVYYTKTAAFAGAGGFLYTDLKRIPYSATSIGDFADKMKKMMQAIIQFEPEVILSGMEVTDVDTMAETLEIAAGLVLFNGKLLTSAAYVGDYPAYLKEDGGWVTAEPVAGLYIKFDPYTSQRYKNVLDRALTPTGRIVMEETLSDRFDAGGVGRWEMKGYELMSEMQARVPVGLWYDGVALTDVTDSNFEDAGNQGGYKNHELTPEQLPVLASSNHHLVNNNGVDTFTGGDNNAGEFNNKTSVPWPGIGQKHNNLQPYTVVVYAKRVA
jgi:hypothetical protein